MDADSQWLALLAAPGLGPVQINRLLDQCGTPGGVLGTPLPTLRAWGIPRSACTWLARPDSGTLRHYRETLSESSTVLIARHDPRYPGMLREIPDPPPVLFVRGDPACLGQPQLAVVGSRRPTPVGREIATELAFSASKAGFVVTSGLAAGIDAAAHRGALEAGGPTIAVMGTGPERVYPVSNRRLAEHILRAGTLATEFLPGTPPRPHNFPRRNRIISGLSAGTLVVEAATRSGSLITARLAGEHGRAVMAVPGSINSDLSRGCHRLIRDGARLVEGIADVLDELGCLAPATREPPEEACLPEGLADVPGAVEVLESMGFDTTTPDQLVARCGLTAEAICSILFALELQGIIETVPGGGYVRISKRLSDETERT